MQTIPLFLDDTQIIPNMLVAEKAVRVTRDDIDIYASKKVDATQIGPDEKKSFEANTLVTVFDTYGAPTTFHLASPGFITGPATFYHRPHPKITFINEMKSTWRRDVKEILQINTIGTVALSVALLLIAILTGTDLNFARFFQMVLAIFLGIFALLLMIACVSIGEGLCYTKLLRPLQPVGKKFVPAPSDVHNEQAVQ